MTDEIKGLHQWMERFSEAELPAMAVVVHDLLRVSQQENASVKQLADILLRDAALTSKVLRVSNSVYCNPGREVVRTISRAVVVLGFEQVRMIGLSISLLDTLGKGAASQQLQSLLARSFHGAVQARNLAQYVALAHKEEVFIAGLLQHLGELAFWSLAGEPAEQLAGALAVADIDRDKAVRRVLGFSFEQLTQGLLRSWNLGDIGHLIQSGRDARTPAARALAMGSRVAEEAQGGWHSEGLQALIKPLAGLIGGSPDEALQQVLASAHEATDIAAGCGAHELQALIPSTEGVPLDLAGLLEQEAVGAAARATISEPLLQGNVDLLKLSMQNMALMVKSPINVETILSTLMNGLHLGAGLERVMLAVLADNQSRFKAKRVVGKGTQAWLNGFDLPCSRAHEHIFGYALRQREVLWMGTPATCSLEDLSDQRIREYFGDGMFFIAPILAGNREIGVLYADMRVSGREPSEAQFAAFKRFTELTGRCLQALGRRG